MPILTRHEAFELAWSEPMRDLGARFGMSDVGLKKALLRLDVPLPPQGHWNKVKAGKAVVRPRLPPRGPAMPLLIELGDSRETTNHYHSWPYNPGLALEAPEPRLPIFDEELAAVESRVSDRLKQVKPTRDFSIAHPLVRRLLAKDEERRLKQENEKWFSDYYAPHFSSAFEQRRLKVLNSLLLAASPFGVRAESRGPKARELWLTIGVQNLQIWLDHPEAKPNRHGEWETRQGKTDRLKLVIGPSWADKDAPTWEDQTGEPLERRLGEITSKLILSAEAAYRDRLVGEVEWKLKRREEARRAIIEAEREAREEAERKTREEAAAARQRLLSAAADHRAALDLRALIDAVDRQDHSLRDVEKASAWKSWARRVADELDPLTSTQAPLWRTAPSGLE